MGGDKNDTANTTCLKEPTKSEGNQGVLGVKSC